MQNYYMNHTKGDKRDKYVLLKLHAIYNKS